MRDVQGAEALSAPPFKLMLETLERIGVAADAVLSQFVAERGAFADSAGRFPSELEERFWYGIERLTDDSHIGLRLGAALAQRAEREVCVYLALNSGTLRRALSNLLVLSLLAGRARLELREEASSASIGVVRESAGPLAPAQVDTTFACIAALFTEHIAGFRLAQVELTRARPASVEPYTHAFGVTPYFAAAHDAITFDRSLLDAPIGSLERVLAHILSSSEEALGNSPPTDPLLARLESALRNRSAIRTSSLTVVARALATSPRTLRRHLNERGTTFRAVLDRVRQDLARRQLRDPDLSMEEVAEQLGFSSTSAFQRAFRRWYGVPPSIYRARLRVRGDACMQLLGVPSCLPRHAAGAQLLVTSRKGRSRW